MTQTINIDSVMGMGNSGDLTQSDSSARYPLGYVRTYWDPSSTKPPTEYMYIYNSGSALTIYNPYVITMSATASQQWGVASPGTSAVPQLCCVPQYAIAATSYGWVAIRGYCKVTPTSTPTAGHYGKVVNAGTVTDEASISVNSFGIFLATAAASATPIVLFGFPTQQASS